MRRVNRRFAYLFAQTCTGSGLLCDLLESHPEVGHVEHEAHGDERTRRPGAWEDYIRQTLRDEGLPEGLAALPHVE